MITGINTTKVITIAKNAVSRLEFRNRCDMTKAATEKAIPTA